MIDTLSAGHLGGVPLDTSARNSYIKLAIERPPRGAVLTLLVDAGDINCEWDHLLGRKSWVVGERRALACIHWSLFSTPGEYAM